MAKGMEMRTERSTNSDRDAEAQGRGHDSTRGAATHSAASDPQSVRPAKGRALGWFGRCFYACGGEGLPQQITCLGAQYALERVLKHDFHAATGLYGRQESEVVGWALAHAGCPPEAPRAAWAEAHPTQLPSRLIGKINRRAHFCLVPLGLIGRLMTHSEVRNLRRCEGIREVPKVLARIHSHMYVYEYIEGQSLHEKPALPADFFDRLLIAMQQVHARHLVHFDLHKPGNILVDTEGRPHIIDFQIARHIGDRFLLSRWLSSRLRRWLQSYDLYHIYKHKRRLQPQLLTEAEERLSYNHSLALQIQRAIAKPYKKIRRAGLRYLYAKGVLSGPQDAGTCVETNPVRWTKANSATQKNE